MMKRAPFFIHVLGAIFLTSGYFGFCSTVLGQTHSSGGANGQVNANASTTHASHPTFSKGSLDFGVRSQAAGSGTATSTAQAKTNAAARVGHQQISLKLSSASTAHVASQDTFGNASAATQAGGKIGRAELNVTASAKATSAPGQWMASAHASDGSWAVAAVGAVNLLHTNVPGGVTETVTRNEFTRSISCNAGGTCSTATVSPHSAKAAIRLVSTTGLVAAEKENAMIQAWSKVGASASRIEVSASASSAIRGWGTSSGKDFSVTVSSRLQTATDARANNAATDNAAVSVSAGLQGSSHPIWTTGDHHCVAVSDHPLYGGPVLQTRFKCP